MNVRRRQDLQTKVRCLTMCALYLAAVHVTQTICMHPELFVLAMVTQ
jgi:hypothetical protein